MTKIGVSISGGGHRASLFGLGVLMYLADAGKSRDVIAISSVSGGSITNAQVGLEGDFQTATGESFAPTAGALASQIANRGTLFAWSGTWVYLVATVLAALLAFGVWVLPLHWFWRLVLFLVALAVWDVLFWRRRGDICARAYAATALKTTRGSAALADLAARPIDHIMCATHLNAGEHMYLSGRFAYSYRFGWGKPRTYPLHKAVQASTALPGAFPPRWLPTADFQFSKPGVPGSIPLVDGGVYDNMADQWFKGIRRRSKETDILLQIPDEVVLVNASASMQMQPVGKLRLPLLGELFAFQRDMGIMYDNSASLRKSGLITAFDIAARQRGQGSPGMTGALIDIASNPYSAPEAFVGSTEWPDRALRATAALQALEGMTKDEWAAEAEFSSSVKTTLSKLGVDASARVLRHAYALASANLHVLLGYPLLPVPSLDDFRQVCR